MVVRSEALLNLAQLRINLQRLMRPEILAKLAEFLEKTAYEENSMLERYKWFVENGENGAACKYASMARDFFLKDQAEDAAKAIIWLYRNWAVNYE